MTRLIAEDAVGMLRRREGRMAALGSENGEPKLDWVEGVPRLLADPERLTEVEAEARSIRERGLRHVIWAGMGGSVMAVRVLVDMGLSGNGVTIYPLDSTDPAALNAIVRRIATDKGLAPGAVDGPSLRLLLGDVMMIGVSMGMTSEEPITHLSWFIGLLQEAGLQPAQHLLVMTLPGSLLDDMAHENDVPTRPLQPDGGTGTGGRMSAPTTRVFLLPAALLLTGTTSSPGALRRVLSSAWQAYDLDGATRDPAGHSFVRLAAALSDVSEDGACHMLLSLPEAWRPLFPWLEQLMEESLGKGGKGVVVFEDQRLNPDAPCYHSESALRVQVAHDTGQSADGTFTLVQPSPTGAGEEARLAAVAARFLGWQLTVALYGYLEGITFAGQPAVENYKARARALRERADPLEVAYQAGWPVRQGGLTLVAPSQSGAADKPAAVVASTIQRGAASGLSYLDLTLNGEMPAGWEAILRSRLLHIGNILLGVPVKLRRAPSAYHSTEQSEMDGPPGILSLRILARRHERVVIGSYDDTFLQAQAVGTWQAMVEQGRECFLLIVDGSLEEATEELQMFCDELETHLRSRIS